MGSGWKVARIAGVDIKIDASWLIIALLIGYTFWLRFDWLYPEEEAGTLVALAVFGAVVFFGSVVLHELAHAVMARARGIEVQDITLFLFGGATRTRIESKGARDEFIIAVVGPLTSLAIGLGLWGLVTVMGPTDQPLPGVLGYLAWLNVALAVFNLLPGFPLDGGRLLRAVVWGVTGDLDRATRLAANGGKALGYGLVALGLLSLLGGAIGGLWLAAIGWFLAQTAEASYVMTHVERALRGIDARDVMAGDLVTIPAEARIEDTIADYFLRYDHSAFPVERDGRTVGLLTLRAVRRLDDEQRRSYRAGDCMVEEADLPTVRPSTPMHEVMKVFEDDHNRVVVAEDGQVVGLITPSDVNRWMRRWDEVGGLRRGRQQQV